MTNDSNQSSKKESFDALKEIGRLWQVHNEAMRVIVRLEERFTSFEKMWEDDRNENRPTPLWTVAIALLTFITTLSAVFWLFIEVRVAPIEQTAARVVEDDKEIRNDLSKIEIRLDNYAQLSNNIEWLIRNLEKDARIHSILMQDRLSLEERVSTSEAKLEQFERWIEDVDKGGSRKWIGDKK